MRNIDIIENLFLQSITNHIKKSNEEEVKETLEVISNSDSKATITELCESIQDETIRELTKRLLSDKETVMKCIDILLDRLNEIKNETNSKTLPK